MGIDCDQYIEVETKSGKKKCFYYVNGGMCTIPENRWCIVAPPKIQPEINQLSFSTVSSWKDCRRYTWLDKFKRVRPKVRAPYFIQGSVLHELEAGIYENKIDFTYDDIRKMYVKEGAQEADAKPEAVKAIALMTSYIKYMGQNQILQFPNLKTEQVIETTFNGHKLVARIDGVGDDGEYFVEHKFVGGTRTLDKITKLENEEQSSLYFMVLPKAKKMILNLAKKVNFQFNPLKETIQVFMNRVKKDMDKHPGKYFRPVVYERDCFDLEAFEQSFANAVEEMMSIPRDAKWFYKNPKSCAMMGCQFQSICETGVVNPDEFYVWVPSTKNKDTLTQNKGG